MVFWCNFFGSPLFMSFSYIIMCNYNLFTLSAVQYSILWIHPNVLSCSTVYGHLDHFFLLSFLNSAVMNILVDAFWWTYRYIFLGNYLEYTYSALVHTTNQFTKLVVPVSPPPVMVGIKALYILAKIWYGLSFLILVILVSVLWSHIVALISVFLMISKVIVFHSLLVI